MSTLTRYGVSRDDVGSLLTEWGEPRYRSEQVWDALWRQRGELDDASSLPRALRERLTAALPYQLESVVRSVGDRGDTTKWLWQSGDGAQVETVLMCSPRRASVCVSSQAGCAMGCTFCATGQAGFERHLDTGEILEQVLRAQHASSQRVSHVVFMGMGEPLANFDAVWESVGRLHDDLGLSARHLTISTVGIVPGMLRLARERLPVTLAVSLHAPNDTLRDTLVPVNRRYPLADVLDAARAVAESKGRRVTFEYAIINHVNDRVEQAEELARRLRPLGALGAHVNVIPLNPTGGFQGTAPDPERTARFAARLRALGINATVRRNRGTDIDAACGQLRTRAVIHPAAPHSARMAR